MRAVKTKQVDYREIFEKSGNVQEISSRFLSVNVRGPNSFNNIHKSTKYASVTPKNTDSSHINKSVNTSDVSSSSATDLTYGIGQNVKRADLYSENVPVKPKRGRPRKNPDMSIAKRPKLKELSDSSSEESDIRPKKRGRPRKIVVESELEHEPGSSSEGESVSTRPHKEVHDGWNRKINRKIDDIDCVKNQIQELNSKKDKLEKSIQAKIEQQHIFDNLNSELIFYEKDFEEKKDELFELTMKSKELEKCCRNIKTLTEEREMLVKNIYEKDKEISSLEIDVANNMAEYDDLGGKQELLKLTEENLNMQKELRDKKQLVAELNNSHTKLQRKITQMNEEIVKRKELKPMIDDQDTKIDELQNKYEELKQTFATKTKEKDDLANNSTHYTNSRIITSLKEAITKTKNKIAEVEMEINSCNVLLFFQSSDLNAKLDEQKSTLANKINELKLLKKSVSSRQVISEHIAELNSKILKTRDEISTLKYPESIKMLYLSHVRPNIPKGTIISYVDLNKNNIEPENLFCVYTNPFESPPVLQYDSNFRLISEFSCIASLNELYKNIHEITVACDKHSRMVYNCYWRYKTNDFVNIVNLRGYSFQNEKYYINRYGTVIDVITGLYVKPIYDTLGSAHVKLITSENVSVTIPLDDILYYIFVKVFDSTKYVKYEKKSGAINRVDCLYLLNRVVNLPIFQYSVNFDLNSIQIENNVTSNTNTQETNTQETNTQQRNTQETNTQQTNTQETNSQETNTQQRNTQETNTQQTNTQETNSQETNTQQRNSQETNTQQRNTQETNSQETNTQQRNTQQRNTQETNTQDFRNELRVLKHNLLNKSG